ncbi:MAG: class I SAM-dependent methyltransferase [Candidatus Jorgensenbacteria bacterium]
MATDLHSIKSQFSVWRGWYGRFLPKDRSARILDLGCGRGGMVHWLQSLGYASAEGIDISRESIQNGIDLGIRNIHHGDAVSFLKDKRECYDAILLVDVLGFLIKDEIPEILKAVAASLRTGGVVIARVSNAESPMTSKLRYEHSREETRFTEMNLKETLERSGFKNVGAYPVRPVIHGVVSFIRYCLWRVVEGGLKCYRLIEAGSPSGVFTQNMIVVGRR